MESMVFTIRRPFKFKHTGRFEFVKPGRVPLVSRFDGDTHWKRVQKYLETDLTWIETCMLDFLSVFAGQGDVDVEKQYPLQQPDALSVSTYADEPEVRVRVMGSSADTATVYPSFHDAIRADGGKDTVIEWRGTDALAALDVDFHRRPDVQLPTLEDFERLLPRVAPQPCYAWTTHGRGFRLIFRGYGPMPADELAAVAWLSIRDRYPDATVEIKHETRHPRSEREKNGVTQKCGPVSVFGGMPDISAIRTRLSDVAVSERAVEDWLTERKFKIGARYSHKQCVIDPSDVTDPDPDKGDPVCVFEHGVFCHRCKAKGDGYRSFRVLCGSVSSSIVGRMARGRVHWQHAKHVFARQVGLTGPLAELCYRAALRCVGNEDASTRIDDAMIRRIMSPGLHYLRFDGFWASDNGETLSSDIGPILATLPACDGSPARVAEFRQPISLERYGYFPIRPVWGCSIATVHPFAVSPDAWSTDVVFYPPMLRQAHMQVFRPRYVPELKRDTEVAWKLIEAAFPGVNRNYLKLLIAAKGCVEAKSGMPTMLFVSGCTAASKSATVKLAASICGDRVSVVEYVANPERRGQMLLAAKERCSFLLCDEVNKSGADAGKSASQTMQYILNLDPNASAHKLYVGQVEIGSLPVFVWTDTTLPEDIRDHAQIARRLTWVELTGRVDWKDSLRNTGVLSPDRFRVSSEQHAQAANVVLSDVIDEFFSESPDFHAIATTLGFQRVEDYATTGADEQVRTFFAAVCRTLDADPRVTGEPGWVEIDEKHETDLVRAWESVRDENGFGSRLIEERDLKRVLNGQQPIRFETRVRGRRRFVRFVGVRDKRINGELLSDVGVEPATDGIPRSGNPVSGGNFSGLPSIP